MVASKPERSVERPALVENLDLRAQEPDVLRAPAPQSAPRRAGAAMAGLAVVASLLWLGGVGAYLWGYVALRGLAALAPAEWVMAGVFILLPPCVFGALALALGRGQAMQGSADRLLLASERLFAADETAARGAARLGRAVRHEIDALNAGLDSAFSRMRALEEVLEKQIASLDEAGARADVRAESVAARLSAERARIESVADQLTDAASRAGETVAGRAAQLTSTIASAENSLRLAGESLQSQADQFRASAASAATAPHDAAIELDRQAKRIEVVADTALSRAEFVLARQERHRGAMSDLLSRLRDESAGFETLLARQRETLESTAAALRSELGDVQALSDSAEKNLENLVGGAAARIRRLSTDFQHEAVRLKESADASAAHLAQLLGSLQESGQDARALIGETAIQARADAKALVGEAMAECGKLLRVTGEMNAEAAQIRTHLAAASEELEEHLLKLPGMARSEAARVRQTMREETEALLDLSARTMATLHARNATRGAAASAAAPEAATGDDDSLIARARKLTQRAPRPRKDMREAKGGWEMKALLAAADGGEPPHALQPGAAAALGALEAALADLAVDLNGIANNAPPDETEWRAYLGGDRSIFARTVASAIDAAAIDRISALYRDNARFHDAADTYLDEFETMLARAKKGDGDGILTSTLLSADTGKIYLAIAYALGRLEA